MDNKEHIENLRMIMGVIALIETGVDTETIKRTVVKDNMRAWAASVAGVIERLERQSFAQASTAAATWIFEGPFGQRRYKVDAHNRRISVKLTKDGEPMEWHPNKDPRIP